MRVPTKTSRGSSCCLRLAALATLLASISAQSVTAPPLPPFNNIPPVPLTSPNNPYCDVQQVPWNFDNYTCALSNWGGHAVILNPGNFVGTTFDSMDNTRMTEMTINLSNITVRFSAPTAPIVPAYVVVATGLCTSLQTAQACLGQINVQAGTDGTFNASVCAPNCLPESLTTIIVPFAYLSVATVYENDTQVSFVLTRDLETFAWSSSNSATWTLPNGQFMLFIGSLSDEQVQVSATASASMMWRNVSNLPPASPGSFDIGAAGLTVSPLVSALTLLLCVLLGFVCSW